MAKDSESLELLFQPGNLNVPISLPPQMYIDSELQIQVGPSEILYTVPKSLIFQKIQDKTNP